jgi:hypothetical protein
MARRGTVSFRRAQTKPGPGHQLTVATVSFLASRLVSLTSRRKIRQHGHQDVARKGGHKQMPSSARNLCRQQRYGVNDRLPNDSSQHVRRAAGQGHDANFSPSWTAFQADRGREFSVIVDGVSN